MESVRKLIVGVGITLMGLGAIQAQVVINEVLARNKDAVVAGGRTPAYIELYNASSAPTNIGLWTLTENTNKPTKYIFPPNTIIQAHDYLLIWCDDATNFPGLHCSFGLKNATDEVVLYQAGNTSAPVDILVYGIQAPDLSIGRLPDGSPTWKLLIPTPRYANRPVTLGTPWALKINEWMPTNRAEMATNCPQDWLELYNPPTNGPVDLTGLILSDGTGPLGKRPILPLSFIAANGFVRFMADDLCGNDGYDADHLNFKLSSSRGDYIILYPSNYSSYTDFIDLIFFNSCTFCGDYSWGRLPDGSTNIVQFIPGKSTPAESNFLPLTNVVVNEVLAHTDPPLQDAVEFHNTNNIPVDISGFWLTDNEFNPKKYRIPSNTIIPSYGYVVFYEYQFNDSNNPAINPFNFDSVRGDQVGLYSADAAGNLTGYRILESFDATENGVSYGRYIKSYGGKDFVPMSRISFGTAITATNPPSDFTNFIKGAGAPNPYPKVGPIVISEIMYNPPDITNGVDNDLDEYIELSNITSTNVPLFNPFEATNRWKIARGVEFRFPTGVVLPPHGSLLVVNFDPNEPTNALQLARFKQIYNIPSGVLIFGPYSGGNLANGDMTIELIKPDWAQRPDAPVDPGYVPQVLVEKVRYDNEPPWPTNRINRGGYSLHRINLAAYSNDPTNWFTAAPTPGQWDIAPTITSHPLSQAANLGGSAMFLVSAQGTEPLGYQWLHNGAPILGAVSSNLILLNLTEQHLGGYSVIVSNPVGVVTSAVATLTFGSGAGPVITQHPQNQNVAVGSTATFNVVATGELLSYLWQFNNQNLTASNAATLVLTNVQTNQAGGYRVIVSNSGGSATSLTATLTVAGPPSIVAPIKLSNGTYQVTLNTVPGFNYVVEGSLNLSNWTAVATYNNAGSQVTFTDQGTNGLKFFRALIVP